MDYKRKYENLVNKYLELSEKYMDLADKYSDIKIKYRNINLTDFKIDKIKNNNFSHTFNDGLRVKFSFEVKPHINCKSVPTTYDKFTFSPYENRYVKLTPESVVVGENANMNLNYIDIDSKFSKRIEDFIDDLMISTEDVLTIGDGIDKIRVQDFIIKNYIDVFDFIDDMKSESLQDEDDITVFLKHRNRLIIE